MVGSHRAPAHRRQLPGRAIGMAETGTAAIGITIIIAVVVAFSSVALVSHSGVMAILIMDTATIPTVATTPTTAAATTAVATTVAATTTPVITATVTTVAAITGPAVIPVPFMLATPTVQVTNQVSHGCSDGSHGPDTIEVPSMELWELGRTTPCAPTNTIMAPVTMEWRGSPS